MTEAGEFAIDLYTMPDSLTTKLQDHLVGHMIVQGEASLTGVGKEGPHGLGDRRWRWERQSRSGLGCSGRVWWQMGPCIIVEERWYRESINHRSG